ncbi:MAG: LAGLIDADG family homing endonuclease, partial [archaeon]
EILKQFKKIPPAERKKFIAELPTNESAEINSQLLDHFLDELAAQLHGFVGADLEALAKEAAMKALRRYLPRFNLEEETIPPEVLEELEVNKADFTEALKDVQPSALREVTIEVPNVKWSDIGGLDDIKKELKQAVEWPLKNAEQFKKLGITPPRGVLLYGPPGTGKTLLAKAVATESEANFISVKGPQLISMWVGESLPFEEELLVFDGKKIFREQIGKIVEEKKKLKVVTFDSDGRVIFADITEYIKHPLNGKMFELTTKTGRKIRITDKHSIFGLKELEIEPVTVYGLAEGKSVIAVPSRIPNISDGIKEINLFEALYSNEKVMIQNVGTEIKDAINKAGAEKVSKTLCVQKKYLHDITSKNLPIKAKAFFELSMELGVKPDFSKTKIGIKGARNYIGTILPLTGDLFRLIGQWVAEGDFGSKVTRIHAFNEEIRADIVNTIKKLGLGNVSEYETSIVINSYIFAEILREVFGLKAGAFNKTAPQMLLTSSTENAAQFLKGYFSGDGTITKTERTYYIEATTVSKELSNDLMYLLLKFGIVANCKQKKEWTGSISYRVQIHGVDNFRKFEQIGFIDTKRNGKISQSIAEKKWERSNLIPMNEKIKNILDMAFGSYPNNNFVGTKKIRQALQMIDLQKTKFNSLWKLIEADIYWDIVQKIEQIDYEGDVYDISIEPCQNFMAGFGG